MNNINKIISFVLGLIVVIIILLVITGKFNIFDFRSKLITASGGSPATKPTPTKIVKKTTLTPARTYLADNNAQTSPSPSGPDNIKTIPSTGASTNVIIMAFVSLLIGVYLMRMDSTT